MTIDTLEDLYLEQLRDMHSANQQALAVTRDLGGAASDTALSEALKAGATGIESGINALTSIAERHDEPIADGHCKGMEGLVTEARAHALEENFGEDETRDAMIITQYQRLTHYALAGYGCLAAFADRLDLDDDVESLSSCLDETYDGDRRMTELAAGGINRDAAS